jgi:diguanylate cyclase (GGDEF)-like protein
MTAAPDDPAALALEMATSVVNGIPEAAALLDAHLRPVHFNYAFALATGLPRASFLAELSRGATAFDLFRDPEGVCVRAARRALTEGRELRLDELEVTNAGGIRLQVLISLVPLRGQALVFSMRDVSDASELHQRYTEQLALERLRAEELERQLQARSAELRAAMEEIARLSKTDPLTGVLNRRAFTEHAEHALEMAARHGRSAAVIVCDLDRFRQFNERHGRTAGDVVLTAAATTVRKGLRRTDRVARLGGEEFVVLLPETTASVAFEVARRCNQMIRQVPLPEVVPGATGEQTASVGVALFPQHGRTLQELLRRADQALLHAKATGRDRVVLFDPALATEAPQVSASAPRVLLVGVEAARLEGYRESLGGKFRVLTAQSLDAALHMCRRDTIDVLVVEERLDNQSGIDLLNGTLPLLPEALRFLVIDSAERYAQVRASGPTGVDYFLLQEDARTQLLTAIEDGRARLQVSRTKELLGAPQVPSRIPAAAADRLDQLIEDRTLRFVYQPIVSVRHQRIFAYEALCRAEDPMFANPEVLFDSAVLAGRIWKLSRLVRELVVRPMPTLQADRLLFVNLHPAEVDDPELLLGEPCLAQWAHRLVFEITERASVPDFKRFTENLALLRKHGYRFAIDDLGAGYASLNSVALLEPDFIKIDKAMIRALEANARLRQLVRRIVEFSEEAGIQVVAEGVETQAEATCIADLGCHLVQGWYFARPGAPFIELEGPPNPPEQ